ncbi:MAG: hypothetical protein ACRCVN_06925 [Spirochaetia bacterium]
MCLFSCGLPSAADYATPPFNINDTGPRVTFNVRESHAVAIYYRFITSGSTVDENFGNISTDGESILSSKGYTRANDLDVYIWVPTGPVVDPVTITVSYAALGSHAAFSVVDAAGTVFVNNKILLRNSKLTAPNIGFSSPMSRYKDTNSISSGPTDIALAAINYKLNATTIQMVPSVPSFLGYMRGLIIS